jgi:hypothetical protein
VKEPGYEVVWPRGKRTKPCVRMARRLDTLQGKAIAELWEWAFRGDEMFAVLERELTGRYPGVKFVSYENFGRTHGGDEKQVLAALPQKFKEYNIDAVISGVGC